MVRQVSLTSAQSKRLIARGVAAMEPVRRAMREGTVAVCKGTTNSYVLEELLGRRVTPFSYTTGLTLPNDATAPKDVESMPDVVFQNGEPAAGLTATDAVHRMGSDDVFLKGANALNYKAQVAGLLIGHPTGGTIGAAMGTIAARKIRLVIPVGLEKLVAHDLLETARELPGRYGSDGKGCGLFPFTGTIVTEIEALAVLAGVDVRHIGAGGVLGAEGAVWLQYSGAGAHVQKAEAILDAIRQEKPFGEMP
jgi:hypothetical protein